MRVLLGRFAALRLIPIFIGVWHKISPLVLAAIGVFGGSNSDSLQPGNCERTPQFGPGGRAPLFRPESKEHDGNRF